MPSVRMATTQYRTTNNVQDNLGQLVSVIEEAAAGGARLVVTPELAIIPTFMQIRSRPGVWR